MWHRLLFPLISAAIRQDYYTFAERKDEIVLKGKQNALAAA